MSSASTMRDYTAYGLHVRSELPLPELVEYQVSAADPDIHVRVGHVDPPTGARADRTYAGWSGPDGDTYWIKGVGGVRLQNGSEMTCHALPVHGLDGFHHLVSGIGLGMALHQRGALTLHASAVAVDGGVAAFIGWKGMGKSTTAAALYGRGHRLVTDDVLVVEHHRDGPRVWPGYPALKLYPHSAEAALGDAPEALVPFHPNSDKCAREAPDRFSTGSLPLRIIYVLDFADDDEALSADRLSASDACVEMLRNSFALRVLGSCAATSEHLAQVAAIARAVPVRRLRRPVDLAGLADIAERVEADVAEAASLAQAA